MFRKTKEIKRRISGISRIFYNKKVWDTCLALRFGNKFYRI